MCIRDSSEPIQLWRQREVAPVIAAPAAGKESGEMETVDAELKAAFEKHGLVNHCADICTELGIGCVDDMKFVKLEIVETLSWLKPVQREKLKDMLQRMTSSTQQAPGSSAHAALTFAQASVALGQAPAAQTTPQNPPARGFTAAATSSALDSRGAQARLRIELSLIHI